MSAPDEAKVNPPPYPEGDAYKDTPPAYASPQQQMYPPPPGPQQGYPLEQGYQPQQGYQPPQGYHVQQPGYPPQVVYNQYPGGIVTTAPHSTVIVRTTSVQPYDYMAFAIFVTVCCCLPFGIIGIMKAADAKNRWTAGDTAGAETASREAKKWSLSGLVTGLIIEVASVVIIITYYTSLFSSIYGYGK